MSRFTISCFVLFLLLGGRPSVSWARPVDPLNRQLQLLIPGESAEHQSARAYTQSKIEALVAELREDKIARKSTNKQIQRVADYVESKVLRGRANYAPLQDVFRNGTYTQATVTALYALLFQQLGLPFEIRVDLWEVYVVADPGKQAVALFAPGKRRRNVKRERAFVEDYNHFVATLYPGPDERTSIGSIDERFARAYFPAGATLDTRQLSAYLRYREGMHHYGQSSYAACLYALEDALRLDDRVPYRMLRRAELIQLAYQNAPGSREALFYLFQLWQEDPANIDMRDEFVHRFVEGAKQL